VYAARNIESLGCSKEGN